MPFVLSIGQSNKNFCSCTSSPFVSDNRLSTLICFNNSSADDCFTSAYRHVLFLLELFHPIQRLSISFFLYSNLFITNWMWYRIINIPVTLIMFLPTDLRCREVLCNPTPNASWCARIHCRTCIINPINQCYVDICVVATSLSPDFTRRGGWCKLLFAINLTDVCLGTAFMLTSATVQRQWLTTIVPQLIDISFGGHRGAYIEG